MQETQDNPLQEYFQWQVATLMLAYSLYDDSGQASQDDPQARRQDVEREVQQLSLAHVPEIYQQDPELDWPADILRAITRATLARAHAIASGMG